MSKFPVVQPPTGSSLTADLDSSYVAICAAGRDLLRAVRAIDLEGSWKHDGCADMAMWLAGHLRLTRFKAARYVDAAHALERLPKIAAALEAGELDLDRVVELTRFATPENEERLIPWARKVSPVTIRDRGDDALRRPDEAGEVDAARRLEWSWSMERDRLHLYGVFPPAEGQAIITAIGAVADKIPDLPDDARPWWVSEDDRIAQRRADALWMMASDTLAREPQSDRALVVVHATYDDDGYAGAEIEGGPCLHPDTKSRLACDARLQFVFTDRQGNATGIGRASRTPPRWIERYVRHRDRNRCTFPGCHRKTFLQSHHIRPWEQGGPTDIENLVTICGFHHRLVHEYRWSVELTPDGARWFRPDGTPYEPAVRVRAGPH